jgi:hypothetical protein
LASFLLTHKESADLRPADEPWVADRLPRQQRHTAHPGRSVTRVQRGRLHLLSCRLDHLAAPHQVVAAITISESGERSRHAPARQRAPRALVRLTQTPVGLWSREPAALGARLLRLPPPPARSRGGKTQNPATVATPVSCPGATRRIPRRSQRPPPHAHARKQRGSGSSRASRGDPLQPGPRHDRPPHLS